MKTGVAKRTQADLNTLVCQVYDWHLLGPSIRVETAEELAKRLGVSRAYIYKIVKRLPQDTEMLSRAIADTIGQRLGLLTSTIISRAIGGDIRYAELAMNTLMKSIKSGNEKVVISEGATKVNDALSGEFVVAKPPELNEVGRPSAVICTNIGANADDNTNKCTNTIEAAVDDGGKHA